MPLALSRQGRAEWSKKRFDLFVYTSIAIEKIFSMFFIYTYLIRPQDPYFCDNINIYQNSIFNTKHCG